MIARSPCTRRRSACFFWSAIALLITTSRSLDLIEADVNAYSVLEEGTRTNPDFLAHQTLHNNKNNKIPTHSGRRRRADETTDQKETGDDNDPGVQFLHFVAHNSTMTCSADEHARPFNNQIRGVNLGGWMVLEPWITPSIFYQFLGGGEGTTAFDMYTFCHVLGPDEGNRQLRHHWERWVTEDIIAQLAASGAVNSLRLPLGDFQFVPYGPYPGCVDGGLDFVDLLLDWAYSHGLSVLLDLHTMKDSQNGFDNSGQSMGFAWTSALSSEFAGLTTFEHWPIRTAEWIGTFDPKNATYTDTNHDNIAHALKVIQKVVDRYAGHPAILGLEPVNEPWQYTPIEVLKRFYWEGYLIVKKKAPYWKYIMHDSFRLDPKIWGGFMDGCPERALDTHLYQAWRDPDSRIGFYTDACRQKSIIATMEREFGPIIVGEWSLATDNCAMWLNGFNDNLPGFPRLPCKYTPCRDSYLGKKFPGNPIDPSKALQGPYGTGMSGPIFGLCPSSRDWLKETKDNPLTGRDWIQTPPNAPRHLDDTDDVMRQLAFKKIDAFSGIGHGFFFWNFRTDLYEPKWSYMEALERGWIPSGNLNDERITKACVREDSGQFKCVVKKGQIDKAIRSAVSYVFNVQNLGNSTEAKSVQNLTGSALQSAADTILGDYFDKNRHNGATCDFGGVAMLIEENVTLSNEDVNYFGDDEFYIVHEGPNWWVLGGLGVLIAVIGSCCGFVAAMRVNPGFNLSVRHSKAFLPLTRSKNQLLRSSLALGDLSDYDEFTQLVKTDG